MPKQILLFVILLTVGCGLQTPKDERSISVTGVGSVALAPDVAVVRLGVETRAATSSETLQLNSTKTKQVIEALQNLGVEEKSIRTESVQLHPRYEHVRSPSGQSTQTLVGYRASNLVRVELVELANAGAAIDAASQAGANRIDSIGFEISNPTEALDKAREIAWRNAKDQAEQLADLADTKLGKVLSINTYSSSPGPVQEMGLARAAMDAVPIAGGQQEITVRLNVSWTLVNEEGR